MLSIHHVLSSAYKSKLGAERTRQLREHEIKLLALKILLSFSLGAFLCYAIFLLVTELL